jgi:hypothetical protein
MRPPARRPRHGRGRREAALPVVRVQQVPPERTEGMTIEVGSNVLVLVCFVALIVLACWGVWLVSRQ